MRKKILVLALLLSFTGTVCMAADDAVQVQPAKKTFSSFWKKNKTEQQKTATETPAVRKDMPQPVKLSSKFLQTINGNNVQEPAKEKSAEPTIAEEKTTETILTEQIKEDTTVSSLVRPGLLGSSTKVQPQKEEVKPFTESSVSSEAQVDLQEAKAEDNKSKKTKTSKKSKKNENIDEQATDVDIDSDLMEYYPDSYELIATGNVVVTMLKDGTKLYADKMVYNTDVNTIKGYGNVKMVKNNHVVTGDFINLNLNEENILVEKPSTEGNVYKIQAKEGYVYPGQIITRSGEISISDSTNLVLASPGMGGTYYVPSTENQNFYHKEPTNKQDKKTQIRAKVIHIKSGIDHDQVLIKNAGYYYENKKLFTIPRIDLTTNKAQDFIETNLPEMGSFKEYGSYFGPGFVLNVPGGATLKLAPVFQIGRHSSEHDFGFGMLARLHSKNNITEAMWGTVDPMFILRGQYKLGQYTKFQYAHDAYMDEWFIGMRMPQYLFQLVHDRTFQLEDIDVSFRNKFSGGYVSDYYNNHLGTMRFRWQTQLSKVLWSKWNEDNSMGINAGVIGQTSASLYGTGDFQGIVRGGPFIGTKLKNWEQTVAYFQGGTAGHSPMLFDEYMYGKSNVTLRETLRLNKYIQLGYFGSYALLKDNWENKLIEENQFYVMFGPEDFKLAVGYDPVRARIRLNYIITLRGEDMEVPYDKMIIDDADTLGKKKQRKKKTKKKSAEL